MMTSGNASNLREVVRTTKYEPYGRTYSSSGVENKDNAHKYTGQILDDNTGLYYYNARYYDPQLGTFITPDSIVQDNYDPQALNRYSYCRNNPIIYTDPSGRIFGVDDLIIAMAVGALSGGTHGFTQNDFSHFDYNSAFTGAVMGGIGAGFGAAGAQLMGGGISGNIMGGVFSGGAQGAMSGKSENILTGMITGGISAGINIGTSELLSFGNFNAIGPNFSGGIVGGKNSSEGKNDKKR